MFQSGQAEGEQTYVTVSGSDGGSYTAVVSDTTQLLAGQALTTLQVRSGSRNFNIQLFPSLLEML